MIGKVKYIGKSFEVIGGLTNGFVYDVSEISGPFIRVIDDDGYDISDNEPINERGYLYCCDNPSSIDNPECNGVWKIIDDPDGIIKSHMYSLGITND